MSESNEHWRYVASDGEQGPVTADQLRELADSGLIDRSTLVWTTGLDSWIRADQVSGLLSPEAPRHDRPKLITGPGGARPLQFSSLKTGSVSSLPHQNLGSARRYGKSLVGRIAIGAVLLVLSLKFQTCNERGAAGHIAATDQMRIEVRNVPSNQVDPANEGKLIHINGRLSTGETLRNEQFEVSENVLRLSWSATVFQWVEERRIIETYEPEIDDLPNSLRPVEYRYGKGWVAKPIDSSQFHEPEGHSNDSGKDQRFKGGFVNASEVHLGAFAIGGISGIPSSKLALRSLPESLRSEGNLADGEFYTGVAADPQIGDERVRFSAVRPGPASIIAVQRDGRLVPFVADNGDERFLLQAGTLAIAEMLDLEGRRGNMIRGLFRLIGFLMLFAGIGVLVSGIELLMPVGKGLTRLLREGYLAIPFLLALGVELLLIAAQWKEAKPTPSMWCLLLGLAAFACLALVAKVKWQGDSAKRSTTDPHC